MYLQTEIRFKNKSPVSFLINKKCSECHMQADSMLKSALEEGRSLEFCPSCGRLLIPETAKIY
jgi:predicted CXXCH cytochrome family protein